MKLAKEQIDYIKNAYRLLASKDTTNANLAFDILSGLDVFNLPDAVIYKVIRYAICIYEPDRVSALLSLRNIKGLDANLMKELIEIFVNRRNSYIDAKVYDAELIKQIGLFEFELEDKSLLTDVPLDENIIDYSANNNAWIGTLYTNEDLVFGMLTNEFYTQIGLNEEHLKKILDNANALKDTIVDIVTKDADFIYDFIVKSDNETKAAFIKVIDDECDKLNQRYKENTPTGTYEIQDFYAFMNGINTYEHELNVGALAFSQSNVWFMNPSLVAVFKKKDLFAPLGYVGKYKRKLAYISKTELKAAYDAEYRETKQKCHHKFNVLDKDGNRIGDETVVLSNIPFFYRCVFEGLK